MTVKEELRQIRHLDHEIKFMLEQLEELETSLTRISPVLSDMPKGGGDDDKMASGVVKLIELKNTINARIDYFYDYKRTITEIINKIENPAYRRILAIRYFKERDNSFEDIAVAINYSYHRTVRMHGEALLEFQAIRGSVRGQDMATNLVV